VTGLFFHDVKVNADPSFPALPRPIYSEKIHADSHSPKVYSGRSRAKIERRGSSLNRPPLDEAARRRLSALPSLRPALLPHARARAKRRGGACTRRARRERWRCSRSTLLRARRGKGKCLNYLGPGLHRAVQNGPPHRPHIAYSTLQEHPSPSVGVERGSGRPPKLALEGSDAFPFLPLGRGRTRGSGPLRREGSFCPLPFPFLTQSNRRRSSSGPSSLSSTNVVVFSLMAPHREASKGLQFSPRSPPRGRFPPARFRRPHLFGGMGRRPRAEAQSPSSPPSS